MRLNFSAQQAYQHRAVTAAGYRDSQGGSLDDSRKDKSAQVGRIDNINRQMARSSIPEYLLVYIPQRCCSYHQRHATQVCLAIFSLLPAAS